MDIKEQIIKLIRDDKAKKSNVYNELFTIYRNSENKSLGQERYLNRVGFTDSSLKTVIYELTKIYKISQSDIKNHKEEPEEGVNAQTYNPVQNKTELQTQFIHVISNSDNAVKETYKFRDEFPFLSESDCPDVLKALVTDKFNAYYQFKEAHQELFSKVEEDENFTNEELAILAKKAIENCEVDQLIYDELAHYREYKEVLGKHPKFIIPENKNKVEELSIADTANRIVLLKNYINRDSKKAKKQKDESKKAKLLSVVESYKNELILLQNKLDAAK